LHDVVALGGVHGGDGGDTTTNESFIRHEANDEDEDEKTLQLSIKPLPPIIRLNEAKTTETEGKTVVCTTKEVNDEQEEGDNDDEEYEKFKLQYLHTMF